MRLRSATLAVLLLAAAAGAEEQGGAPLESSKQALKALQADQASKNSAPAGRIADSLPQVQTPDPGSVPLDLSQTGNARKSERDLKKKRAEQKNWLLDGVDKLGREAKARNRPTGDGRKEAVAGDEEEKPDSSDPDYLLKLYDENKREADLKNSPRQLTTARRDPIAPFLQGWLGNSPVRGKFFDEFVRKPAAPLAPVAPGSPTETGPGQGMSSTLAATGDRPTPASDAPQANPYLAAMETTATPDAGGSRINPALAAPSAFGVSDNSPAVPAVDPPPPARAGEKKSPFQTQADNEKYFPQLKKF